jgi:hypothetical protein
MIKSDAQTRSESSATAVITTEADPTPLVLSLARTLRASVRVPELRDLVSQTSGTVALRSVNDAQAATLTFDETGVHVAHGLAGGPEPVELNSFPEYTLGETTDPVALAAAKLLSPPLPDWRDAATAFWAANQGTRGFPDQLVVVCQDEEDEVAFGDGSNRFEIHGTGPALAQVLSGQIDMFLFAVGLGMISVVGSAAQLSVMCAAHWKVRFDG